MPEILEAPHKTDISIAGCGLDWRISASEAVGWAKTYDRMDMESRGFSQREWRCQRAAGKSGRWMIGHPKESGSVDLTFFPAQSSADIRECRHVEIWGREIGFAASEAEARILIAALEFFPANQMPCDPHSYLLALGYGHRVIQAASGKVDLYEMRTKSGQIELALHAREVNPRGWIHGRSVWARFAPDRGMRWYNIARLEAIEPQEKEGAKPVSPVIAGHDTFSIMVMAVAFLAGARLQARGLTTMKLRKPLASGEEVPFLAPLVEGKALAA